VTRRRELVVQTLPAWKERIISAVSYLLRIKGMPVAFIYAEGEENEPSINDLKRAEEESAQNRVRNNQLTEKEKGE
jgi:ABC-type Zn uptake system ZnuABC Zn-binding protein ZnuA